MKRVTITAGLAGAILVGACSMQGQGVKSSAATSPSASADIFDPSGRVVAKATATQAGNDISVHVEATGLPAGTHGAHVHTIGSCTAPDFASAGAHWNPAGRQHGKDNPAGMHMGDLPNLVIGADGRGSVEYTIAGASLKDGATPLLDADGSAIVIHAQADDYRTDPSGNSGGRIACGVFR